MIQSFRSFLVENNYLLELTGNIGVLRKSMPQIKSDLVPEFIADLKSKGIKTNKKKISVEDLSASQKEIDDKKVKSMTDNAPEKSLNKPFIVSKDGYIADGHHRFMALRNRDPKFKATVYQVNLPIMNLLQAMKQFSKVKFKDTGE